MNQDKAPEWAKAEIQRIYDRYEMSMSGAAFRELVDALSQAYERGQESIVRALEKMREETELQSEYSILGAAIEAIRSLPIEQEGGE